VFWVGEDRYRPDLKRIGLKGDDGQTYWLSAENVEKTDAKEPEYEPSEMPQRGDRVRYRLGEDEGVGEVFWTGESKRGPGWRVGVKDGDGEAVWLDARQVIGIETGEAQQAPARPAPEGAPIAFEEAPFDDDAPPMLVEDAPVGAPPPMDEPPPLEAPPMWEEEEDF
jgi:hypothetical protein